MKSVKRMNTVIRKELLDAIRDRKSMATALLMPLFFAVVTYISMDFAVKMQDSSEEIKLPIDGKHLIAPLVEKFEEEGIQIVEAPEEPEEAILNGEYDMVLEVTDDFNEDFRDLRIAHLNLLSDHSQTNSQATVGKVKRIINQWSSTTGALRLISRNISPGIANPVAIREINVTSDQRLASKVLAGLPMFILVIAIVAGIGMTADMASGERERRSLEPLLINPVSEATIFAGKWAAAVIVSVLITVAGVAMQFASANLAPLAELGLRIGLGLEQYILIMIILIPVIFFSVALQLLVSFFARSFKDAQAYNSLITMMPMVPGFYLMFNSGNAETWQMFVPFLGPTALFVDIISGDGASALHILITSSISIVCAIVFTAAGVHLLKSEKTIFG